MGGAGAAAVAFVALVAGVLGVGLATVGWRATRAHPRAKIVQWTRVLLLPAPGILLLGVLLPKALLRALAFETSGRIALVALSLVGAGLAVAASRGRHAGGFRCLISHLYFATLGATPIGAAVFGVFRMM